MPQKMLAAERLGQLKALLASRQVLRVEDAVEALRVSPATVRRDLELLEKRGELRRVHGGAVGLDKAQQEPLFDDKTVLQAAEKARIAQAAYKEFIHPGETIYLDGGSTVLLLARLLRAETKLTVVTNSLRAAMDLSGQGPQVLLVGGELRRRSQTMVGPLTKPMLEGLYFDKAFLGTIGLDLKAGITTTEPDEAFTKELVMERAREVILLVDSSKCGRISFARSGRLEQIQCVITDDGVDRAFAAGLQKKGLRVIKA
jgi:DeoR/GlpR family transcriptional regulator of sugar metabolism